MSRVDFPESCTGVTLSSTVDSVDSTVTSGTASTMQFDVPHEHDNPNGCDIDVELVMADFMQNTLLGLESMD